LQNDQVGHKLQELQAVLQFQFDHFANTPQFQNFKLSKMLAIFLLKFSPNFGPRRLKNPFIYSLCMHPLWTLWDYLRYSLISFLG
jgi:hypothetical protein